MPAVLVHDRFLVCDGIGTGTAAPADVSGCHDSCAVIAAEEIEGYKDSKECHEDTLCNENDSHLTCKRSKLCKVCGHENECKVKLKEHMLDRFYFRNIELDAGSFHDVSCDRTCEEAADEFRHLDHRDVVE